jgi:DNA-binding transcriptional MocR family regulator
VREPSSKFFLIPNSIFKSTAFREMTGAAPKLYCILLHLHNEHGIKRTTGMFYTGDEELAGKLNVSMKTVQRARKNLQEIGLIHRYTHGVKNNPAQYILFDPAKPGPFHSGYFKMSWVLLQSPDFKEISDTAWKLYVLCCRLQNLYKLASPDGSFWRRDTSLAFKMGVSESTIQLRKYELVRFELIYYIPGKSGSASVYFLSPAFKDGRNLVKIEDKVVNSNDLTTESVVNSNDLKPGKVVSFNDPNKTSLRNKTFLKKQGAGALARTAQEVFGLTEEEVVLLEAGCLDAPDAPSAQKRKASDLSLLKDGEHDKTIDSRGE